MESTLAELVVDFCERHEFTRGTKTNNTKISKGTTSSNLGKSQQQRTTAPKVCTRMGSSVNSVKPMDIPLINSRLLRHALQKCGPAGNRKDTKATVMFLAEKLVKASMNDKYS